MCMPSRRFEKFRLRNEAGCALELLDDANDCTFSDGILVLTVRTF